jgi:hypothetical protein
MEYLIQTLGAKFCCIFASGCGGAANILTKKQFNITALKDVAIALIVGWIAAEFFIPPIMKHFAFDMTWGPAIAFVIGYCGIRLLPAIENRLKKVIKDG